MRRSSLAAGGPQREQRKTATVVFCDVTGSTELGESTDPEALRARLARYFERMKGIVESHGGTVEKFIGDAVMAVVDRGRAHPKLISARLGHSTIAITLDRYGHLFPSVEEASRRSSTPRSTRRRTAKRRVMSLR